MKHLKFTMENETMAQERQQVVFLLKMAPPNVGFYKRKNTINNNKKLGFSMSALDCTHDALECT
jgi:hypothetical protein